MQLDPAPEDRQIMEQVDRIFAPVDEAFPEGSLLRALQKGCLRTPAQQMVVGTDDESLTYASAYHGACALAQYLRTACGIDSGSTVMLLASNIPEYPLMLAAIEACGARAVLLSAASERGEVMRALSLVEPQLAIVTSLAHRQAIAQCAPDTALMTLRCPGGGQSVEEAVSSFRGDFACNAAKGAYDQARVVVFSSGSTGCPKAIVHRSHSFWRNAQALGDAFGMRGDDVLFLPVPFAHVYGVLGIYAALASGATIVTCSKYRPETAIDLIASTRATLYFGVPTMYLRELRASEVGGSDLSTLRAGLVAGASCPEAVFEEYERRWNCTLAQSYGMTETAATLTVSSLEWPLALRAGSVGLPIEGVKLKLAEETGEILCKSPSLMEGIMQASGILESGIDGEGWFHSGDIGAFDEAGRLSVVGRIKDIIIRGGINIYPAEIENVYQENPLVSECCLVGYPDPDLGERTCLCAIMGREAQASAHELRDFARGKVEKFKIPDVVLKVDEFPRLPNGKIDKKKLMKTVKDILTA